MFYHVGLRVNAISQIVETSVQAVLHTITALFWGVVTVVTCFQWKPARVECINSGVKALIAVFYIGIKCVGAVAPSAEHAIWKRVVVGEREALANCLVDCLGKDVVDYVKMGTFAAMLGRIFLASREVGDGLSHNPILAEVLRLASYCFAVRRSWRGSWSSGIYRAFRNSVAILFIRA